MANLAINLVTRGRPERVIETAETALDGCGLDSTRLMVSIDDDDWQMLPAINRLPKDPRLVVDVRPREDSLGAKYNRVLALDATLYTHMSDYAPCVTRGWDEKMLEAASFWPDGIGVVFSNYVNFSFAGIYGVTRGLVDKLGWFYPPYFPYWFLDHWIDDIAKLIDRVSYANITIETPRGKPGTQELRELPFWTRVFDAGRYERRRQAMAIIDSEDFLTPPWEKEVLRRQYPITEFRSRYVSELARELANELPPSAIEKPGEGGAPERYMRLREKAIDLMHEWAALGEVAL